MVCNNSARNMNESGSGGGLRVTGGGSLHVINCSVAHNAADVLGGGLCLGSLYSLLSSCSLAISSNSYIGDNTALQGANQVYSSCGGNVSLSNSEIHLTSTSNSLNPAEVRLSLSSYDASLA